MFLVQDNLRTASVQQSDDASAKTKALEVAHIATVKQLTEQITSGANHVKELEVEARQLQGQIADLNQKLDEATKRAKETSVTLEATQKDEASAKALGESLRKELDQLGEAHKKQEEELAITAKERDETRSELSHTKESLAESVKSLKELDQSSKQNSLSLQKELADLHDVQKSLEEKLSKAADEHAAQADRLTKTAKELDDSEQAAKEQQQSSEAALKKLQSDKDTVEAKLQGDLDRAEEKIASLTGSLVFSLSFSAFSSYF